MESQVVSKESNYEWSIILVDVKVITPDISYKVIKIILLTKIVLFEIITSLISTSTISSKDRIVT